MSKFTFQNKIRAIENSSSLGELPLDAMPYAQSNEYYFVSYSHVDYKEVYCDILRLQELGINIWYDRGLPAGRDWEKTAHEAIVRHSCIGVIFYLSENSLMSKAVAREIKLVKELGKDYVSINLPFEGGSSISASAMLDKLCVNNKIDRESLKLVKSTFNENIIFIDYNASSEFKADKISLLKRQDLLNYEIVEKIKDDFTENRYRKYDLLEHQNERFNYGEPFARIVSINDIDITEITIPKMIELDGKEYPVREIGECAFANCKYLESVEFPPVSSLSISEKAFYACKSLKKVNLAYVDKVGEFAFTECDNLEEIIIGGKICNNAFWNDKKLKTVHFGPSVSFIGSGNFVSGQVENFDAEDCLDFQYENNVLSYYSNFGWNTSSLAICGNAESGELTIPIYIDEIAEGAFSNYKELEKITFQTTLDKIGKKAFYKCDNLNDFSFKNSEKAYVSKSLVFDESSFAYCTNLTNITIPRQTTEIKNMAFLCCTNIKDINFESDSNLKVIDRQAFDRCLSLEKLNIPDSVEIVGINAFAECNALEEVIFSENSNLREIHAEAFVFCKKLNKVVLPKSIKTISQRAFFGCDNLKELYFLGTVEEFEKIGINRNRR